MQPDSDLVDTGRIGTTTAESASAEPTLAERAAITRRIGLDEATRELGAPLHAIDGMVRELVGLVTGHAVPEADPSRPLVRALYVDRTSGRMLFLDQQRMRPGHTDAFGAVPQTGPGGRQRWVNGNVLLVLHGDLPAESLAAFARRVR